jgi:hypothetical protein
MDKILRNVIIFIALILILAVVFVGVIISNRNNIINNNDLLGSASGDSNIDSIGTVISNNGEIQNVKLSVVGGKYILTPSVLKKDIPVRLEADLTTVVGCSRDIVISSFDVRKYVKEKDNIITFTPTKTGTINIACSMNMYRGTFTVVDT